MKRTRTWLLTTSGLLLQRCDLQTCFKYLKFNVLWIKLVCLAFLSYVLLFHRVWACIEAFSVSCLFSGETRPQALTRWKRFKTASNTVKQQRIRQESKKSQFYSQNIKFLICKVPIQTLVNRMTARSHESRSRAFHFHFNHFNYFLSSRAWAACGFARRQAAAIC